MPIRFAKVREEQMELGRKVRALLQSRGFPSVAAEGYKAPGVVVQLHHLMRKSRQRQSEFSRWAARPPLAFPLQCDEGRTSRPSVSACSAWTNGMTRIAPWVMCCPRHWTISALPDLPRAAAAWLP